MSGLPLSLSYAECAEIRATGPPLSALAAQFSGVQGVVAGHFHTQTKDYIKRKKALVYL